MEPRSPDNVVVGAVCGVEYIGRKLDGLCTDSAHPSDADIWDKIENIIKTFLAFMIDNIQ